MHPEIQVGNSILMAVPAIHYKTVFAREIYHLCCQRNRKPDAIAVELGPQVVLEIIKWMKELGVGPEKKTELPCMLGFLAENKLIHPKFRETAFRIQEYYRKPINRISPSYLHTFLNYSPQYLLSLSSTDSIVEAIRCGVESDIPVYGIDMDGFSMNGDSSLLIQHPDAERFDLGNFVLMNEKAASLIRDDYVDSRRENVMAARLKTILAEHENVVFTCGLSHWESIKSKLADPGLMPAQILLPESKINISRVLIHPALAVRSMDIYPILSTIYEEKRPHVSNANKELIQLPDGDKIFSDILQQSYSKYFSENSENSKVNANVLDSERIADFEHLLSALRLVQQRRVTPMSDLVDTALRMMPEEFNKILFEQLMDIARPWASPTQFPGLPLISQTNSQQSELESESFEELFQLTDHRSNDGKLKAFRPSQVFGAKFRPSPHISRTLLRYWHWKQEPEPETEKGYCHSWIWPPCESLLFGSAYEAQKIAITHLTSFDSAVFEGSLYNGLDVKATMRSIISGERKIYIKKPLTTSKLISPDGKDPEPTVFIFGENKTDKSSYWSLLIGGTNLGSFIKNKDRYHEVVRKYGSYFISSISMTSDSKVPASLKSHVDSISMLDGFIAFGSPCINAKQGAEWVEDNDFKACPVLDYTSYELLVGYYKKFHNMEISNSDWKTALIQFALPFAKERVVLVAPENFKLPPMLIAEAKARNVSIDRVSLNYFSPDCITLMRNRITVRAMDSDGFTFSTEIEDALGQKADTYLELLPPYMQQQLGKTNNKKNNG